MGPVPLGAAKSTTRVAEEEEEEEVMNRKNEWRKRFEKKTRGKPKIMIHFFRIDFFVSAFFLENEGGDDDDHGGGGGAFAERRLA